MNIEYGWRAGHRRDLKIGRDCLIIDLDGSWMLSESGLHMARPGMVADCAEPASGHCQSKSSGRLGPPESHS